MNESKEMMEKQPMCRKGSCSQALRDPSPSSHDSTWNILSGKIFQGAPRGQINLRINLFVMTSSGDGHPSLSFWDWA